MLNYREAKQPQLCAKFLHKELVFFACQKGESRVVAYCHPSGSSRVLIMLLHVTQRRVLSIKGRIIRW